MTKTLKNILITAPLVVAVYLIWKKFKSDKEESVDTTTTEPQPSEKSVSTPAIKNSVFPLQKGNKGSKVKELQLALLKYDKNILPKYGADGDFGSETEAAVLKALKKKRIDSQNDIETIKYLANRF